MARKPAPGPVVIAGCTQVKIVWRNGNLYMSNVVHGRNSGSTTVNDALAESLFSSFKAALVSSGWTGMVHSSVTLERVTVKDLTQPYLPEYESSSANLAGTGTGGAAGDQVAFVVTHRTAKSGAQWRGRTYLGGLASAISSDGRNVAQQDADKGVAFVEAIRSALGTSNIPMVVAQRHLLAGQDTHGNQLPERAANMENVTRVDAGDLRLDTQRRRLGR